MKCRFQLLAKALLLAASVTFVVGAHCPGRPCQGAAPPKSKAAKPAPELEAKVMELLRAMSGVLTSSSSMAFTAVATYESPSIVGPPLAFTTTSEVLVQRPNKLRVITSGDGRASEYYYDGKTLTAFAPSENLVAVAPAPPTIDAMLEMAFKSAAIYFPFADVLGADPFRNITEGLTKAFYVGPSTAVGGTTTDVVAVVSDELFMQIWIGAEDKLPRRLRAVLPRRPASVAPSGGTVELEARSGRGRGGLCIGQRGPCEEDPVRRAAAACGRGQGKGGKASKAAAKATWKECPP